jgi:hypothetical protein
MKMSADIGPTLFNFLPVAIFISKIVCGCQLLVADPLAGKKRRGRFALSAERFRAAPRPKMRGISNAVVA